MTTLFVVRLFDMMDGWMDVTGPLSQEAAQEVWNEKTGSGTHSTEFKHGDYYAAFPADTRMLMTPDFLGR